MPITQRLFVALLPLMLASLPGCAHRDPAASAQVLLLGETHDNGEGHRLRADALRERIEAGWRPAIAMEQFDRENQALLDAALRECPNADCVVARAAPGKSSWTWAFYTPVLTIAMQYHLPVLAANLSRADAGKVIQGGLATVLDAGAVSRYGLDKPLASAVLATQVEEVRTGHCGLLPEAMLEPMALAQVARDVVMAETLRPFATRGVVLIAGNGHVRRDIAVPYWLRTQGINSWSVGFVEQPGVPGAFDRERRIAALERPDPCAELGKKMGTKPGT
ncbi:ChaN family lipoprotein [Thermomonas sp.]